MDTAAIIVTLGGVALIVGTLWFFFGGHETPLATTSGAVIYACPMHPWITSTDPSGECSICGMKLVRRD